MAKFIPNPNLLRELAGLAEVTEATHRTAEKIAETAQQIAPVGTPPDDSHPGEFRDGISADGANVVADSDNARFVIFGTSHSPPHDTLRRAAEIDGYRITK